MNKVYYFTASWCSPCKTFGPLVEQSGIPYQKVDIDNDTELAAKFGVRTVPSLVRVNDLGQEIGSRIVGVQPVDKIKKWYNG
tara:strand:- start:436 stop:681 length:246 start_codon:yes stop_codon:yes gene_type:complete